MQQLQGAAAAGHVEVVRCMLATPDAVKLAAAASVEGKATDAGGTEAGGAAGDSKAPADAAGDGDTWLRLFSRAAQEGCDVTWTRSAARPPIWLWWHAVAV
ncbi:hypothetical protein CHLRE_09g391689v5 [Chlamydomonas reinhardtii]|uniref:Uncharacterized protein n=1 Tax=Chlamydomonas reinhardtii TaxID=3055 RepID=A0A2K3DE85_CHLRE|nr:uncharacterized protein CHLRE_09g391689v5 [Chlamydomonas reinhardtii]PNW78834.1 hypothetical protein CHLRE_09g391689v5 [Chlamydomonas reinhardtii]